jgi:alpha-ribazole phosphatase/probable phosphoglycerate mutase
VVVVIQVVFETHATTVDNERGIATGWLAGTPSESGRAQARELGRRRRDDGLAAVFTSDLGRAVETSSVAFAGTGLPILRDWRLRECDYETKNGMPTTEFHHARRLHLDEPYPAGESWRAAVSRVGRFLGDLPLRWGETRVLVIGHVATRWALDHFVDGVPLERLIEADFGWQQGWEYVLSGGWRMTPDRELPAQGRPC